MHYSTPIPYRNPTLSESRIILIKGWHRFLEISVHFLYHPIRNPCNQSNPLIIRVSEVHYVTPIPYRNPTLSESRIILIKGWHRFLEVSALLNTYPVKKSSAVCTTDYTNYRMTQISWSKCTPPNHPIRNPCNQSNPLIIRDSEVHYSTHIQYRNPTLSESRIILIKGWHRFFEVNVHLLTIP